MRKLAVVLGVPLIVGLPVMAYDLKTHKQLTEDAVHRSTIDDGPLQRLGIAKPIHDSSQRFPNSVGALMRIDELISIGAVWEDTLQLTRVFHHFYNPATGQPLTVGAELGFVSPDWALEERGQLTSLHSGEQRFSYRDARRYLFSALTERMPEDRDRNWGLVFQSVGHIVHHIQDMAQPQHARNDAHCGSHCANAYPESAYERWTEQHRANLPLNPLSAEYDVGSQRYKAVFNHPRAFWHTQPPERLEMGQGMAEFAHRNFVSAGTIFRGEFASPKFDITKSVDIDIRHLMPGTELAGAVRFFSNEVRDDYLNSTSLNTAALSESIFDPELRQAARQPVFSLNRFNFMAAHGYLLPRAVAHSTGLIDYFFRANFELVRDIGDPLKFRVRNLTDEPMNGRFALYEDDADGKRTAVPANTWSAEIAPNGESLPLGPFPGKGKYMMVFDGTQGAERPENGSLGAVGARAIAQCALPYDGDFGPMTVRDPLTGQSWQAASVFVVPAGASSHPRVWEASYRNRIFTVLIEPHIASVVFAMPRDGPADEVVTFIDWGLSEEEATQFFLLPGYDNAGSGLHVEEVCNA